MNLSETASGRLEILVKHLQSQLSVALGCSG